MKLTKNLFSKLLIFSLTLVLFTNCSQEKKSTARKSADLHNREGLTTEDRWVYDAGPLINHQAAGGKVPVANDQPHPGAPATNPDLKVSDMAEELMQIAAEIPNMPDVSVQVNGSQKFRPAFGPIPWRMIQEPNSVKILFIGQDGTHIAEAAGRPATAGFGGRAQDLAAHFGVSESAAFINTYAFTIQGQYSVYQTPYIDLSRDEPNIKTETFVHNDVWLITQSQKSPITKWRNRLIDWIIRNNKDSLKLIVTFGKSANDSIAAYIESKGGDVKAKFEDKMDDLQFPLMEAVRAGGNNQASDWLNENGKSIFAEVYADKKLKLAIEKNEEEIAVREEEIAIRNEEIQRELENLADGEEPTLRPLKPILPLTDEEKDDLYKFYLKTKWGSKNAVEMASMISEKISNPEYNEDTNPDVPKTIPNPLYAKDELLSKVILTNGGPFHNGIVDPAQLGSYNLDTITVNGTNTRSLKGLSLNDGDEISQDLLVVELPHPTYLSNVYRERGGRAKVVTLVEKNLSVLSPYRDAGWKIDPDIGRVNHYEARETYQYGRSDIGPEFYDFGTPASRMVSVSSAYRKEPHVVVFGARNEASSAFNSRDLRAMTEADLPRGEEFPSDEMFTARPRTAALIKSFDPGPYDKNGERFKYAKIMKNNLDLKEIFRLKNGTRYDDEDQDLQTAPIENFNIKSHPTNADFGHYRGTFVNPQVVMLADPDGYDDLITARALTGTRGQYLHAMMKDIGVNDDYLVIKTVPFGMDGATEEEWNEVLSETTVYRQELFNEIFRDGVPKLILTDGEKANALMGEILTEARRTGALPEDSFVDWVKIQRDPADKSAGIAEAVQAIAQLDAFQGVSAQVRMANIPRSHLSYYARIWEGTTGDRVLNAETPAFAGRAFAEVVPKWAFSQRAGLTDQVKDDVNELKEVQEENLVPGARDHIDDFIERLRLVPGISGIIEFLEELAA